MAVVNRTRWLAWHAPADDFGQEGLPHAGIADEHDAGALLEELQIE